MLLKVFGLSSESERIITDSAQAVRTFNRLRMKGAQMHGVRFNVCPNAVFTSLSVIAFLPEKYMKPDILVKRKFKSSLGEARHVVIQKDQRKFDIKISKRSKIVNKNYNYHLFDGGTIADYGLVNIHIKQDGIRCFSGILLISNRNVIDGDGSHIVRISYLQTPLHWEYTLREPTLDEQLRKYS